jgi:UDP-N-acetylglucosamine 2-epimerase (non-hydrolysing)
MHVVGARPNFMKMAPVHAALDARGVRQIVVHTGQHYDSVMSEIFFRDLDLPVPYVNLEVGSGTHSQQTSEVMRRFEPVVEEQKPDCVLVYGDVNSTMAGALVCAKMLVPVAHVEAGLRSNDRTMPEEINRVVTDHIADLLLTPSADGDANLAAEGIPAWRIRRVGNVMIDTLVRLLPRAQERWDELPKRLRLDRFGLLTLHRPSNVDDPAKLTRLIETFSELSTELPIVFPIHPRTRESLRRWGLDLPPSMMVTDPLGYLDFLALQSRAAMVITDSGGVQEETTFLGVPCITLRTTTERPVTITIGTNVLVGEDLDALRREWRTVLSGQAKRGRIPELWDGRAADRIADILIADSGR